MAKGVCRMVNEFNKFNQIDKKPLVSIITPGWNGKNFIRYLLDSVLNQTYENIEYIYVDDGSTDGTKEIVLSYQNDFEAKGIQFKFVEQKNQGVSFAVMTALKHVKGKYCVSVEYDDVLPLDSIEKRVAVFETLSEKVGLLISNATKIDEENRNSIGLLVKNEEHLYAANQFKNFLIDKGVYTSGCLMYRMSAFDATHRERQFIPSRYGYAWQTTLPILYSYETHFINESSLFYCVRKQSISHVAKPLNETLEMVLEFEKYICDTLDQISMSSLENKSYKKKVSLHCRTRCFLICLKRKKIKAAFKFFLYLIKRFNLFAVIKKTIELIKAKI